MPRLWMCLMWIAWLNLIIHQLQSGLDAYKNRSYINVCNWSSKCRTQEKLNIFGTHPKIKKMCTLYTSTVQPFIVIWKTVDSNCILHNVYHWCLVYVEFPVEREHSIGRARVWGTLNVNSFWTYVHLKNFKLSTSWHLKSFNFRRRTLC